MHPDPRPRSLRAAHRPRVPPPPPPPSTPWGAPGDWLPLGAILAAAIALMIGIAHSLRRARE